MSAAAKLVKQYKVVEKMNNDLNAENRELREKMNNYVNEVEGLRGELRIAHEETRILIGKMKGKDAQLSNATRMTIDLQSMLERQGDDAKILQNTVDALTRELRDLKTSSADTMMQLQQTTQQLAQRNDELRIASSLASDNANALDSSKEEVCRLTAALESASNDNLRLAEEIGNAALLSNELGDKVNLQTEEITALKDAAKTALQEFKAVRAAKKTADKEKQVIENEMKLLRSDYQGLDKEKQRLESELSKAQELQQTLKDMNTAMRVHRIGKTGSSLAKQYETDLMAEIDSLRNQLQSEQSASAKCSASLKAIKGAMHDAIMSLHCSLGLGMTIEDVDGAVSDGNTGATLGDVCEMVYVELSKKKRAIRSQREALAQAENLASSYAIELSKARKDMPGQQFQHAGQLTRTSPYMIAGCSIVATAVTCLIGSRVVRPSRRRMRRDAAD